jgi:hypothetical protein
VNGTTGSAQTTKGAWSDAQAGPRPIKTLLLGHIDGAEEGHSFSLGCTPQHSRLKYMSLRII